MNDTTTTKNSQLVLCALGADKTGLIDELSRCILSCGCNIQDSHMAVLAGDFALLLQVDGNWNTLTKLEDQLEGLGERLELVIKSHRTSAPPPATDLLPYAVDVVALNQPGIVHNLAHFFSERQINIQEMVTNSYQATHSGSTMFSAHLTINIKAGIRISDLREEFAEFCDNLNLDAVIEPIK